MNVQKSKTVSIIGVIGEHQRPQQAQSLQITIRTTGPDGETVYYYYAYDDGAGRIYDKEDNLITTYYIRGADGQACHERSRMVMAEYNFKTLAFRKLWL